MRSSFPASITHLGERAARHHPARRSTMKVNTVRNATVALTLLMLGTAGATGKSSTEAAQAARADIQKTLGFVPQFLNTIPDVALPGIWNEMKSLQLNPGTALSAKNKELLGLGVAAQIPCHYCIIAHTEFARSNGATPAEIGEAVAMAGITRHWSTFINGAQLDEAKFRGDIAKVVENAKKASANKTPSPAPLNVVDGQSALKDIQQTLGFVPEFLRRFPDNARAGAWREFREVELTPASALPGKNKELIGLAVAAQIPCHYCIIAHTEFAKLNGASEVEISEALAMASLTR